METRFVLDDQHLFPGFGLRKLLNLYATGFIRTVYSLTRYFIGLQGRPVHSARFAGRRGAVPRTPKWEMFSASVLLPFADLLHRCLISYLHLVRLDGYIYIVNLFFVVIPRLRKL